MKTIKLIAMLFFAIFVSACGPKDNNPPPLPAAPTGVSATSDSSTQIAVSWTAMTDATGYDVYRSITANQTIATMDKLTATPTTFATYADSSLSSNTTYHYKVVANNSNGAGAPSAEVSAITRPSAPTGITATANSGSQITVSWATMIGVASYDVYRSDVTGQALSAMTRLTSGTGTTSNAFVDTGLTNATTYYYKVAANNAAGGGDASVEANALTNSAATAIQAHANSATQINLSWLGAAGDIGYDVYRSTTAGQVIDVMTKLNTALLPTTSYADSGLNPNTTYYYKVRATNGSGPGAPSADVPETTPLLLMGGTMQGKALTLSGAVTTYAGSGTAGSADGDVTNGPNAATFNNPHFITTDGKALYVADFLNNKIRKIVIDPTDPNVNKVTTFAGSGAAGSVNGVGTAATFNQPLGITTDGKYLYVAEYGGNRIRKIDLVSAVVTTVAGTGVLGFLDGAGATARFNRPHGITTDGNNLYVVDHFNHRIRQVRLSDGNVSSLAGHAGNLPGWADGTGTAALFRNPTGIATDGTNVYVADLSNHRIRQIVIITGEVTTIAGSGAANTLNGIGTAASFNQPYDVTTDGTSLYVGDYSNNKIRKIELSSKNTTTVAGSGVAGNLDNTGAAAQFNHPIGVTTDGTTLYVGDLDNNGVRKIQ